MTKVSAGDSCGKDGEYKYEIPDGFDENVRIIFNDGNATNTQVSCRYRRRRGCGWPVH